MSSIDVFHLTVAVTLVAAQWIWLAAYPKVVNTWSVIPDIHESLQELTRVYAERRQRMSKGHYLILGLIILNAVFHIWGTVQHFNNC